MHKKQFKMVTDQSMAASFNSSAASVVDYNMYSISCVFTGAPVGSMKLQVSNDTEDTPTNWDDLDDSTVAISAAGSETYIVTDAPYNYVRIVYTYSSGSGTFNAKMTEKG